MSGRRAPRSILRSDVDIKRWQQSPPSVDAVRPGTCPACGAAGHAPGQPKALHGHGLRERQFRGPSTPGAPPALVVRRRADGGATGNGDQPALHAERRRMGAGAVWGGAPASTRSSPKHQPMENRRRRRRPKLDHAAPLGDRGARAAPVRSARSTAGRLPGQTDRRADRDRDLGVRVAPSPRGSPRSTGM